MKIWKALFGPKTNKQPEKEEAKASTGDHTPQDGTISPPNSLFGRMGNGRYVNPKDPSNPANPFSPNKRDRF